MTEPGNLEMPPRVAPPEFEAEDHPTSPVGAGDTEPGATEPGQSATEPGAGAEEAGPAGVAPAAARSEAVAGPASEAPDPWGYVDDEGNVHQRDRAQEPGRIVGKVVSDARAALRTFALRFARLAANADDLERDLASSRRPAGLAERAKRLAERVRGADAIGDFDGLLARIDGIEQRAIALAKDHEARKAALCERAESVAGSTEWKKTSELIRAMQEEWKAAGSAGREQDALLWARFRGSLDTFFARRAEVATERATDRSQAQATKEELCARAEELASATEWKHATDEFATLMERWKSAGSAGRETDRALWQRFGAARTTFFERRAAHHKQVRQEHEKNRQRKDQLCVAAEALAGATDIHAACEQVKSLQAEWKTLGPAPRDVHEALWQRFRAACNAVFDRAHREREVHKGGWRDLLAAARDRKAAQAADLRESIVRDEVHVERWQDMLYAVETGATHAESRESLLAKIADVDQRLAAKRARLLQLEVALSGIEEKLGG